MSRPHLVLVHGSRLSSTQWTPLVPLLEPYADLTLVDLPGHGARAGEAFTMQRCVEVVQEAVRAAATRPGPAPVVVGHSLGGYVATAHAAQHAADLGGLVLAGCTAVPVGPGAWAYRAVAALTDRLGEQRMTRINLRVLRRAYPPEVIEPVIAGGFYFAPTPDAWRAVMTHCRPEMLTDVRCPVTFLNGQWDQFRVGVRRYVQACPHARVRVVPRATHLAPLDQPAAFAGLVLEAAGLSLARPPAPRRRRPGDGWRAGPG